MLDRRSSRVKVGCCLIYPPPILHTIIENGKVCAMNWLVLVQVVSAVYFCEHLHYACNRVDVGLVRGTFDKALASASNNASTRIFVVTTVDSRNAVVAEHFIRHYLSLGILPNDILVLLHTTATSFDNTTLPMLNRWNVSVVEWIGPFSSAAKLYHQIALLALASKRDWLLYADVDEFARFTLPLSMVVNRLQRENCTHMFGTFVDRVSADGSLLVPKLDKPLGEQFPRECHVTKTLLHGTTQKVVLVRGDLRAGSGHHVIMPFQLFGKNGWVPPTKTSVPLRQAASNVVIDHYKWVAGVIVTLAERRAHYRDVLKLSWWRESNAFLEEFRRLGAIDIVKYCSSRTAETTTVAKKPIQLAKPGQLSALASRWLMGRSELLSCPTGDSGVCLATARSTLDQSTAGADKASECRAILQTKAVFDKKTADHVLAIVGAGSLAQFDAESSCYSFYWATHPRLRQFEATDPRRALTYATTNHLNQRTVVPLVRHVPYAIEAACGTRADWIISLEQRCSPAADANCLLAQSLARCAYYGVILVARNQSQTDEIMDGETSVDSALESGLNTTGFAFAPELTRKLRQSSDDWKLRQTLSVFTRRRLVAQQLDTTFLQTSLPTIGWNNQVTFAGRRIRVFIPSSMVWAGRRTVVGVLSIPNSTDLRHAIRETWASSAKRINMLVAFLVANPAPETQLEAERCGDMILFECPEVYERVNSTLPLKTHAWIQLAARYAVNAQWLFKCDDDTFVIPQRLQALLETLPAPERLRHYVGHMFETPTVFRDLQRTPAWAISRDLYPTTMYPSFMSGGAGYALSISAVHCIALHTASSNYFYFPREDVSVRLALYEMCEPVLLHNRSDAFFLNMPNANHTPNIATVHHVKEAEAMQRLWNLLLSLA